MTKVLLYLLFALSFCNTIHAQEYFNWVRTNGGIGFDGTKDVAVDHNGNVFHTGDKNSNIYFAKHDANGQLLWQFEMGNTGGDHGQKIATDNAGNVYLAGSFESSADFDPGPGQHIVNTINNNPEDIFFAKYDPNGNFVWVKTLEIYSQCRGLEIDKFGNIWISAITNGTTDIDPGPNTVMLPNESDAFVIAKYDNDGNYLQHLYFPSALAHCFTVDTSGKLFMAVRYNDTIDVDPGSGVSSIYPDGTDYGTFIASYDNDLNFIWVKELKGTTQTSGIFPQSFSIANDQGICFIGSVSGIVDMDGGPGIHNITSFSSHFLAKYSMNGDLIFAGIIDSIFLGDVAVSKDGNIFLTGFHTHTVDMDITNGIYSLGNNTGDLAAFYAGYSSTGDILFAYSFHDPSITSGSTGQCITVDTLENVYIGGYFRDTVDFCPDTTSVTRISNDGPDMFVMKFGNYIPLSTKNTVTSYNTTLVYPNPATDRIYIKSVDNIQSVQLYDVTGSKLIDTNKDVLATDDIPDGVYIVRVKTSRGSTTEKITIRK